MAFERTSKRDNQPHVVGHFLRNLAGKDAAQAPADQADLAAMAFTNFFQAQHVAVSEPGTQAAIAAQIPAVCRVAPGAQKCPHRRRRDVAGRKSGKHQHGMAVACRQQLEPREKVHKRRVLVDGARFPETQMPRRRFGVLDGHHRVSCTGG